MWAPGWAGVRATGLDSKSSASAGGPRAGRLEEIKQELQAGIESMQDEGAKPAEIVFDELREACGLPIQEKDQQQDELYGKVIVAIHEYGMYGRTRERKRILASLETNCPG